MAEDNILSGISSPSDLKDLSAEDLDHLAEEIREEIVKTVSKNGGHLASNLGVVELTIALHTVFNCPEDKIVWDVGHQSYAHKLLTGRAKKLHTIRTENGLSGFPKRSESKYDAFDTGHSSTSVSAAFGISCANSINNDTHFTVAVIGDGALSGGLSFEGLNCAGRSKERLIVVLNDNKMSISKNVGSMARYLTKIRIRPSYINAKIRVRSKLKKIPLFGKQLAYFFSRFKHWTKVKFFGYQENMFEQLGFKYYGPFDGHNILQLQTALSAAKRAKGPVIVHVCTTKGLGYEYAEKNPKNYHGISAFDVETGEPISSSTGYSDIFGQYMCSRAESDGNICAITAAMAIGTGLSGFAEKYKNRFFDVGIAEEHAVTFACGLAVGGVLPVFAVYSTFLQRGYDQILHDAAMQELHVVFAIDRAGIVGEDGETHQGIFDVAFMNTIPGVTVYSPSCFGELEGMLELALYENKGVVAVRYPRGGELYMPEGYEYKKEDYSFFGNRSADILLVTYGRIFSYAAQAADELRNEGTEVCILKLNKIKPIADEAIGESLKYKTIYFFEEGIQSGGVGEVFGMKLYTSGYKGEFKLIAIDGFVKQAKVADALHKLGLDKQAIKDRISSDNKSRSEN